MADIVLDFANKIRNKPVSAGFLRSLNTALTATDPRLGARIISGGQPPKGKGGRRTGSTRHDVDKTGHAHTGDLVLTIDGRDVLPGDDKALYANFFRNAAPFFPGIGHYPWGVHVGSGSTAAWGPTKTRRSLDPVFARAIRAGRTGRKPKEVAQGAVADITPIVAPDSAIPRPKPNPRGIRPEDAAAPPVNVVQFAQDAAGAFIEPAGGGAAPGAVPVPAAAAVSQTSQDQPDASGAVAAGVFDPTQFGAVLIEEPVAATATGGADVGPVSPAPLPETLPPAPPVAAPAADPAVTPAGAAGAFDPTQFGAVALDAPVAAAADAVSAASVGEDPGFFDRIGARLSARGEQFGEIGQRLATGQTPEETILQSAGTAVGGAFDVLGEAVTTAAGGIADAFSSLAPDTAQSIAAVWADAVGSDVAQAGLAALQAGQEAYSAWAAENPRAAANLGALVNIGFAAAPTPKGARLPTGSSRQTPVGRAATGVERAAARQEAAARADFVDDLILPKQTVKERTAQAGRTDIRGTVELTPQQREIATTVSNVPEVVPSNPLRQNLQAIEAEVTKTATALEDALKASGQPVPRRVIDAEFDDLLASSRAVPSAGADIGKATEKMIKVAQSKIGKRPTVASLLDARRSFDSSVKRAGAKLKPSPKSTARTDAAQEVRRAMNDLIARFAPDVDVRGSLRKQSNLLEAAENIGPKAAVEAATRITRLAQKVDKVTNFKRLAAAGAGIAGLGIGGVGPEALAATTGLAIAYVGGKALMSAKTKRALAGLLRETDLAIRVASRTPRGAQNLRADRAALVEVLQDSEVVQSGRSAAPPAEQPRDEPSLGDRLRGQLGAIN